MNTRSILQLLVLFIALSTCTACATLAHGAYQEIRVESEPEGALVFIGTKAATRTPTTVRVARRSSLTVRLEKDGFEPLNIPVKRSVSGWVAGDAVALNPFSCQGLSSASQCPSLMVANLATLLGIDVFSGAAFKFPKEIRGVLARRR